MPADVRAERGWRAFMVDGPLDFGQTGVLAGIAEPLARAGISIFVVSTFDTDYLLVRAAAVVEAQQVLAEAGRRLAVGPAAGADGGQAPRAREAAELEGAAGLERDAGPEARPNSAAADLLWIQNWYAAQCDGDWEHAYGVSIGTIDNPRWWVKIDLKGTDLEGAPFAEISRPEPEPDWLSCRITEGRWEGAGGPHMLGEILAPFVAWAREVGDGG